MPRLSAWLTRTALAYLAAGFTFGGLLLLHKGLPIAGALWRLLPLHIESVLIGWTLQLALGIAYWILPRHLHGAPRGAERPAWAAYVLFNLGVLLVLAGAWFGAAALTLAGRVCELAAVAIFGALAWPRVKTWGR
jgi:cbb3-type cytochrome oxidase subunit 1